MKPGKYLDHCLLEQHDELIGGLKADLTDVSHSTVTLDDDNYGLADKRSTIIMGIF